MSDLYPVLAPQKRTFVLPNWNAFVFLLHDYIAQQQQGSDSPDLPHPFLAVQHRVSLLRMYKGMLLWIM